MQPPSARFSFMLGSVVAASLALACGESVDHDSGVVEANGVQLAYQVHGDENDPAVLFIQGVGAEMAEGPDPLTMALVSRGFRVILFDNRDSRRSTRFDAAGPPDFAAIQRAIESGNPPPLPYALDDMAADAVGLLDALGIERAHVVGGSAGGMIAQVVAAEYPARVASLTLISSTTGNPALPQGDVPSDLSATDPGAARQGAAAAFAGDLRPRSAEIAAPIVVLHGDADTLFPVEHGKDLAATIPEAELRIVPGMGHVPADSHTPVIVDAILSAAERAERR